MYTVCALRLLQANRLKFLKICLIKTVPTPEDIPQQSDYSASQRYLVCQPDSYLSDYSPANKLTGKVAFITGGDFGDMIINTGSVVGKMNKGMLLGYSISKGAVDSFTKSFALNLGDRGIWVRVPAVKRRGLP